MPTRIASFYRFINLFAEVPLVCWMQLFYLRGSSYRMRGKEPVSLTSAKSEDSPPSAQG